MVRWPPGVTVKVTDGTHSTDTEKVALHAK
jgi:hypothetical protein